MVTLVNKIASLITGSHLDKIKEIRTRPLEAQQNVFFDLLNTGKKTFYGEKFAFHTIRNYREFSTQVPIVTYEEIEPEIEKARKGAPNILWPGKVDWFAKSSGTTNAKSKFIPITKDSLEKNHFACGRMLFSNYLDNHPNTVMFTKKNLRIGGSADLYQEYGTKYGDLSAIMIDNLPFWTQFLNTPNKEISLLSDWNIKLDAIAQAAIKENVASLTGVPSWMLVLLNHCLKITNAAHLNEIWPDLEVFFHGGISFTPYLKNYQDICQKPMRYYEIYNASEGYFAMQDQPNSKDMLLMLNTGIFFEFIPMSGNALEERHAIPLEEVKLNENYAVVISSNGGLWRYLIGDTVKFKSLNPYRIIVSGRTKHYINAFGEEIIIENAEEALHHAATLTQAKIKEYTGAPIFMENQEKGAHEWMIEFEKKPDNIEHFARLFDEKLKTLNSDYEAKRYNNMTLAPPKINIARNNLFYDWMKQRGKLGGQNKVPRLCNTREYIDPLLKMND